MRPVLATLLLLSSLWVGPAADTYAVRVIFLHPTTNAAGWDRQEVTNDVANALAFWHERSPIPVSFRIESVEVVSYTHPISEVAYWSSEWWPQPVATNSLTIFVVETSEELYTDSANPLVGFALPNLIWVKGNHGDWFAAVVAHEIGHAIFGLPHQYQDAGDIMGLFPPAAYMNHTIGCSSLAALGYPCTQVYLPILRRES